MGRKKSALERQLEASIKAVKRGEKFGGGLSQRLRARDGLDMPSSLEDPLDYPPETDDE